MNARALIISFTIFLLFAGAVGNAFAGNILTVTKTADTSDGVCDADCSLREAVAEAASGDTIVFSSLFLIPQTITLIKGQINISRDLTITGPGINYLSVSGNNAGRIFQIGMGAIVSMTGLKLRDGRVGGKNPGDAFGGAIRVFESTSNLTNVELSNNFAVYTPMPMLGSGGAIYAGGDSSKITLENVNVHHNTSGGKAVDAYPSVLNIKNSMVADNMSGGIASGTLSIENSGVMRNNGVAVDGSHIQIFKSRVIANATGVGSGHTLTIDLSTISENGRFLNDGVGGGVNITGVATIRNTVISNNKAQVWGGGIISTGTVNIINSAIIDNTALNDGGGIFTAVGDLFLTNTTVSGNVALGASSQGLGGGIYNATTGSPGSRVISTNSSIVRNTSSGKGGGIRQDSTGNMVLRNTIIAENTSLSTGEHDVAGLVISEGVNLVGNSTGSSGWIEADILNMNPLIAPLANNGNGTYTHALLSSSPAINAGNTALAIDPFTGNSLTFDQRAYDRVTDVSVDVGAYEANYSMARVAVAGHVTTLTGRGIDRVRLRLDDGLGNTIYTQTNPFGFYRFVNLLPGTTYTIIVNHKLYSLTSPVAFTADQDREDLNFIGTF